MKILVIGGTGFIGRHLVPVLQKDYELFLFHRGQTQWTGKSIAMVKGHRKDLPLLRPRFDEIKPDLVIDLIPFFAQDAWDLVKTFRQITGKVIAISSGDVYRAYEIFMHGKDKVIDNPLTERSELRNILYPYRGQDPENYLTEHYEKILVETILSHQEEFDTTILRLAALYGEFDVQRKLRDYLNPMLKRQNEITLTTDLANWKWTRAYIGNVVNGIKLVIDQADQSRNQIYNLGQDKSLSQLEFIRILKTLTDWQGSIQINSVNPEDGHNYQQHLILSTDKIRRELGYQEVFDLEEGLKRTIDFEKGINKLVK